jgi:hypothetical protein
MVGRRVAVDAPRRSRLRVEWDAGLVEDAVARAIRGHGLELRYRLERNACYARPLAERDAAFRALHERLFSALGLGAPLCEELQADRTALGPLARVAVVRALSQQAEGADLFALGRAAARPLDSEGLGLGIALLVETLADPVRLRALLRRELLHVGDLLDPAFGFEVGLEHEFAPPPSHGALRQRYRELWRATVHARLGGAERDAWAARLSAALPREVAEELLSGARPTHRRLLELAAGGAAGNAPGPHPGSPCGACGFPTHAFVPGLEALPDRALQLLRRECPRVATGAGLCLQCADLYAARGEKGSDPFSPSRREEGG